MATSRAQVSMAPHKQQAVWCGAAQHARPVCCSSAPRLLVTHKECHKDAEEGHGLQGGVRRGMGRGRQGASEMGVLPVCSVAAALRSSAMATRGLPRGISVLAVTLHPERLQVRPPPPHQAIQGCCEEQHKSDRNDPSPGGWRAQQRGLVGGRNKQPQPSRSGCSDGDGGGRGGGRWQAPAQLAGASPGYGLPHQGRTT